MTAPRPDRRPPGFRIVFEDAHLVVIEKPSGISSVPYERKETGTAMDLIRGAWRRAGKRATATPLYIVHRIDKDTSGLLCFAKTRLAERGLHEVFQRHTAARAYLAVAEGDVGAMRIESHLVADRGDGIRGSTPPHRSGPARRHARRAAAPPAERRRSAASGSRPGAPTRSASTWPNAATRWSARRSTSATLLRAGGHALTGAALMLHAALLGFPHPVTGAALDCARAPPADFVAVLEALGGRVATSDGEHPLRAGRDRRGDPRRLRRERRSAPRTCPDGGHDPAFLERTAPLLEFLWSRYFRVRLLGIENVPDDGAALLVGNHSGGHPLRRRDAALRRPPRPPAPPPRAPAGRQLRVSFGLDGQRRRAHRLRARLDGDRAADAGARRAGRRVSQKV